MAIKSKEYYNSIADEYSGMLRKRAHFLHAVECKVQEVKHVDTYLDIGCGDGSRSLRIIEKLKPKLSVLIDESDMMLGNLNMIESTNIQTIVGDFLTESFDSKFGLITCLWNVLGHLENKSIKQDFLNKIYDLLDEKGVAFFDVNNRYNFRNYGFRSVSRNMLRDLFKAHRRGYYRIDKGDGKYSEVYIHNPFELDKMIKKAGFMRFDKVFIDYDNGETVNSYFKGQVLYKVYK